MHRHEVHECMVSCGTRTAKRVAMPTSTSTRTPTNFTDISDALDTVNGGAGAGRAIVNAAKTAWNAARPWLGRADSAVDTFGKYAGGALAAKEGYDLVRGNNGNTTANPPTPPTSQ